MDNQKISIAKKSQSKEIFQRFLQNKAAVVGLMIILIFVAFAVFPEFFARYGYDDQDLTRQFLPPSWEHPFGTDDYGRDIFSRVVYGSRISLVIGVFSITFSCAVGVLIGSIAGYYSSTVDNILMRGMDIMLAMPSILLAISIVAAMGVGFQNLIIAIGVASIPQYARIVRASVLSIKDQEYIEAARSIGASNARIIFRHILPNCLAPIIVQATMSIATAILSASALSFIGLGISPPIPEWGAMLSAGRSFIRDYWYVVTFPGLAIMMSVFAFNLFGDGLRDALDPRLKK